MVDWAALHSIQVVEHTANTELGRSFCRLQSDMHEVQKVEKIKTSVPLGVTGRFCTPK